jgi:integrase
MKADSHPVAHAVTALKAKTGKGKPDAQARLSNDMVTKLAVPPKGAVTHWDEDPKAVGFGIRIYASGTRSFFINYRINGIERRYTIGAFPRWSVTAARERAVELRKAIDKGSDPAGEKRKRLEAPTIADLIKRYDCEHLVNKTAGEERIKAERKMLEVIGDELGRNTPVAVIHDGDIREMHIKLTKQRGPVGANRILACASSMFSLSLKTRAGEDIRWRDSAMGNPCSGVARNPEEGRERFFSAAEVAGIADALTLYPPEADPKQKKIGQAAADCVRLIMLTGCRPSEAMKAEWSEFSVKGEWSKPSAHVKQRKTHKVPLAPPAIELIEKLRNQCGENSKYVFPGRIRGERISTLCHVWGFVRQKAKLEPDERGRPARPYDLRHTFASTAAGSNYGLPIIGRLLGHTQPRTTAKYAHLADDPLKVAADRIGTAIANAGKPGAEVVPIRGSGAA